MPPPAGGGIRLDRLHSRSSTAATLSIILARTRASVGVAARLARVSTAAHLRGVRPLPTTQWSHAAVCPRHRLIPTRTMSTSAPSVVPVDAAAAAAAAAVSSVRPAAAAPLPSFSLVVAATQSGGIGLAGQLPWPQRSMPADMKFFKTITSSAPEGKMNVVIMGRKTWESIPANFRPLAGRINILLTKDNQDKLRSDVASCPHTHVVGSLLEALSFIRSSPEVASLVDSVFVVGGSSLYRESLQSPLCHTIYLTRVLREFPCDTHIPAIDCESTWHLETVGDVQVTESGIPFQFQTLQRRVKSFEVGNAEEQQYLDLVRRVLAEGVQKGDRTGTGTKSIFGAQMRFSLRDGRFPLLTSKRVFWRGVVEELIWLIRGCTDSKALAEKKVHIWDDNGSRAFLDKLGFSEREVGDLGPVYGHQWRFFGAKYSTCHADYSGQGVDQLAQVIHTIKTNPNDRRIIMSAWNPTDLSQMALPPCHVMCQFYVANGELSCQMYQRSCDLGLGVPFNIASYSLLTVMIAHVCDLKPGEFVHVLADAHVYLNHVDPLLQQLERTPRSFPSLRIKRDVTDINQFTFDDFELTGYQPLEAIKMQMAV